MSVPSDELDAKLLDAHASNDIAVLATLYAEAANRLEATGDVDACCFYLTHAFIYALESGMAEADNLNRRLAEYGRAPRLDF